MKDATAASHIKYVAFYDTSGNIGESRAYALSAAGKMDYICKALNRAGFSVLIVSPSRTSNRRPYRGKRIQLDDAIALKLFPTLPWGNRLQRALSLIAGDVLLFCYLVLNTSRGENIIVYHSLGFRTVVRYAKKLRGFRLILEVEEIYQDVQQFSSRIQRNEYASFRDADAFIFSTELLNTKLNHAAKPSTVVYGTYQAEPDRMLSFHDGRIHAVYAGIIDLHKAGAAAAASAAKHLDSNYHIHIMGFGSAQDVRDLQQLITTIAPTTDCRLTYDGLLSREDYSELLQRCDIGLCTQNPEAALNETSFPSKILSYMANGLRVVSIRIQAVADSKIAEDIVFYDAQDPAAIAEAIRSIDLTTGKDHRALMERLDREFVESLRVLSSVSPPE